MCNLKYLHFTRIQALKVKQRMENITRDIAVVCRTDPCIMCARFYIRQTNGLYNKECDKQVFLHEFL